MNFDWSNKLAVIADRLPNLLITIVVGYAVILIVRFLLKRLFRISFGNKALKDIILSTIDIALWILFMALVLQQLGLNQVALALSGSVAVIGLAVSMGSSSFIADLIAGIFLAQDRSFHIGERIKVNDIEGHIEKMDARKVRIRDDEGNLHIYPNSIFDKAPWVVLVNKEEK